MRSPNYTNIRSTVVLLNMKTTTYNPIIEHSRQTDATSTGGGDTLVKVSTRDLSGFNIKIVSRNRVNH